MPLIARAAAALAAACLLVHMALVWEHGASAAPMLALSIVCAVCSRHGWSGRLCTNERVMMIVLGGGMLALHSQGHMSHQTWMPALVIAQIGLALISGPLTGPAHRPSSTRLPR